MGFPTVSTPLTDTQYKVDGSKITNGVRTARVLLASNTTSEFTICPVVWFCNQIVEVFTVRGFRGSLKLIVITTFRTTSVAPFTGFVPTTVGLTRSAPVSVVKFATRGAVITLHAISLSPDTVRV